MVYVGFVHKHIKVLQEELTWATDNQLQFIGNIMLFKTVMPLRN